MKVLGTLPRNFDFWPIVTGVGAGKRHKDRMGNGIISAEVQIASRVINKITTKTTTRSVTAVKQQQSQMSVVLWQSVVRMFRREIFGYRGAIHISYPLPPKPREGNEICVAARAIGRRRRSSAGRKRFLCIDNARARCTILFFCLSARVAGGCERKEYMNDEDVIVIEQLG